MENITVDTGKVLPVKNPVDNAIFFHSSDINVPFVKNDVYLNLKEFNSATVEKERIKPLDFIIVTTGSPEDEKENVFHSFKEADSFLRGLAKDAPSIVDGCDRFLVYVEWENKHEAAFKGYTMNSNYVYLTKEMENEPNIIERSMAIRNLYDANLLTPKGVSSEKLQMRQERLDLYPKDKDYLVTSLKHLEGLNKQLLSFVRQYENYKEKDNKISLKPTQRPVSEQEMGSRT